MSACAVHSSFPFICFRGACVKGQLGLLVDIGSLKKRIKGKIYVMQKKRNKKQAGDKKQRYKDCCPSKETDTEDSVEVVRGKNIDYYKYLLLFKLKTDTSRFDSIVVKYTSQYRTITKFDQSRLNYMLDTVFPKRILMVYIRENYPQGINSSESPRLEKSRTSEIRKYLHHSGIPLARIKILKREMSQESLSPPRL